MELLYRLAKNALIGLIGVAWAGMIVTVTVLAAIWFSTHFGITGPAFIALIGVAVVASVLVGLISVIAALVGFLGD